MKSFADYSLPQLKKLQMRITTEIERRESDTKASLLKRLRKLVQTEGIKLEDLLGCDMGIAAPGKRAWASRGEAGFSEEGNIASKIQQPQ